MLFINICKTSQTCSVSKACAIAFGNNALSDPCFFWKGSCLVGVTRLHFQLYCTKGFSKASLLKPRVGNNLFYWFNSLAPVETANKAMCDASGGGEVSHNHESSLYTGFLFNSMRTSKWSEHVVLLSLTWVVLQIPQRQSQIKCPK